MALLGRPELRTGWRSKDCRVQGEEEGLMDQLLRSPAAQGVPAPTARGWPT